MSRMTYIDTLTVSEVSEMQLAETIRKANAPLVVKGYLQNKPGVDQWDFEYLRSRLHGKRLQLKDFSDEKIRTSYEDADQYIDQILDFETSLKSGADLLQRPAYCHDIPIFHIAKELIEDVKSIGNVPFPSWYRAEWWKYAQFFMSSTGSVTPLHFDTLLTHNIFFQVHGKKEFLLIDKKYANKCYRQGWRWFSVDPTKSEFEEHPDFNDVEISRVILEAGDMFYMPPGMLHHVTTLAPSISFNVDFHTPKSVFRSFGSIFNRMPRDSIYYNGVAFLGLIFKVPPRALFRYYQSYLNYIS